MWIWEIGKNTMLEELDRGIFWSGKFPSRAAPSASTYGVSASQKAHFSTHLARSKGGAVALSVIGQKAYSCSSTSLPRKGTILTGYWPGRSNQSSRHAVNPCCPSHSQLPQLPGPTIGVMSQTFPRISSEAGVQLASRPPNHGRRVKRQPARHLSAWSHSASRMRRPERVVRALSPDFQKASS